MIEAIGTAVVLCGADDGRPLGANEAALALLGCDPAGFLALDPDGLAALLAGRAAAAGAGAWHGDVAARLFVLTPPDGTGALADHLLAALERSEADHEGAVAVLWVDLDGGGDGDEGVGPAVAERLRAAVRRSDLVLPVGPGRFAVVCERLGGEVEAAGLAAGVVDGLAQPVRVGDVDVRARAGVAVSLSGDRGMTAAEVAADPAAATAAAEAEARARRASFASVVRRRSDRNGLLARAVADALRDDDLDVHYQPIIDLRDGTTVGVEALARWQPAAGPAIGPDRFIPVAERSGLIDAIGDWVLRRACRYAADRPGLDVAVNVSPRQVRADLVGRVIGAMRDAGLPASRLRLELTESAFLDDPDTATAVLRRLTALGVRLSLDDFGTGYSSLQVLRRLPFDRLKIDRSVVRPVADSATDRDVVAAVLALARAVGVAVTAEGVETEAQASVLADLGCGEGQGFLYGRPMDPAACDAWLEAAR